MKRQKKRICRKQTQFKALKKKKKKNPEIYYQYPEATEDSVFMK